LRARRIASACSRFDFSDGFLVKSSALHLAIKHLRVHFFFEYPQSLVDVVVANEYLQNIPFVFK